MTYHMHSVVLAFTVCIDHLRVAEMPRQAADGTDQTNGNVDRQRPVIF